MPEFDKLSEYADEAALSGQTAFIIKQFDQIEKKALEVAESIKVFSGKIDLKGISTKGVLEDIKKLDTETKQYASTLDGAAKSVRLFDETQRKSLKTAADVEKVQKESVKTQKQKEAEAKKEAKSVDDLSNDYKQLSLSLKEAERRYANLFLAGKANTEAGKEALQNVKSTRAVLDELDQSMGNYQRKVGNYSSAFTGFANTLRGVRGPTKLLGEALGIGAQEADQFRLIIEHAAQGIAAFFRSKEAKAAAEAEDAVATGAAATANTAYTTTVATGTAATNTFTVATGVATVAQEAETAAIVQTTVAARALRIALLATGIGLVIGLVALAVYKYVEYKNSIKDAAEAQKIMNEINEEAVKGYGKEGAELIILKAKIESSNVPMKVRLQAIKDIKEAYPDYFKGLTTEQLLAGDVADAYDRASQAILRKARANAAEAELEKIASQKQAILIKSEAEAARANELLRNAKASVSASTGGTGGGVANIETEAQVKQKILAYYNLRKNADQAEIDALNKKQAILLKYVIDGAAETTKIEEEKKTKTVGIVKQSTKEILDAEFELYKIRQTRKIATLDTALSDSKKELSERLVLSTLYNDAVIELAQKTSDHEIAIEQDKLKVLNSNLAKEKGTERNNTLAEIENTESKIKILRGKFKDEQIVIEQAYQKKLSQIEADEEVKRLELLKKAEESIKNVRSVAQGAVEADAALRTAALDQRLHDGVISQKKYAKEKANIDNDSLILSLTIQKTEAEGLREVARARGEDLTQFDNAINALTGKLKSATLAGGDKKTKGPTDDQKKILDDYLKIEQAAQQTITALVDAKYDRELKAIQKVIDLNNERKEKEISNISESTLSAQEKAAQIIIQEKKVAANNEKLARDQAAIKTKQAKFDRDAAILQIFLNAAVAEYKLIGQSGYAGIVAGAAVAAAAIAEIGVLLAKPLPTYGDGTDNHPGGDAIIGERYKPELVEEPGKKPYILDTPTLVKNLGKGSKVTPFDELNETMNNAMRRDMVQHLKMSGNLQSMDSVVFAVQGLKGQMEINNEYARQQMNALKKQKGANVNIYLDGSFNDYIRKAVKE